MKQKRSVFSNQPSEFWGHDTQFPVEIGIMSPDWVKYAHFEPIARFANVPSEVSNSEAVRSHALFVEVYDLDDGFLDAFFNVRVQLLHNPEEWSGYSTRTTGTSNAVLRHPKS